MVMSLFTRFTFSLQSVIQGFLFDPGKRTEILSKLMNSTCPYTTVSGTINTRPTQPVARK
jgi:hypothetical protein